MVRRGRLQHRNMLVGMGSISMLLIMLALAVLCPELVTPVSAATYNTNAATITTAHIGSVLAVAIGVPEDMLAQPDEAGAFTSSQAEIKVRTNNPKGYQIFLETLDGEPYLVNVTSPNVTQKIGPIVGSITKKGFMDNPASYKDKLNTWGYALVAGDIIDTTPYVAVPMAGSAAIKTTNTATTGDNYNLSFGALVNSDLPGGTYSNTVVVTIVPVGVSVAAELSLDVEEALDSNDVEATTDEMSNEEVSDETTTE